MRPSASTPCPITRQPQCPHVGARAWIAHSKESNVCVSPALVTWNALSYSFPQTSQTAMTGGYPARADENTPDRAYTRPVDPDALAALEFPAIVERLEAATATP